jgi:hypothetical protein
MTTMNHLTDVEMVDAAEGEIDSALSAHLAGCGNCAAKVSELRDMLRSVAGVAAPEPSPLFWDHLGARINAAIDQPRPSGSWLAGRRLAWLGAAFAVLMSVIGFYATRPAFESGASPSVASGPPATNTGSPGPFIEPGEAADAMEDDEAWAVVRSIAGDLHYDDARDAGVLPRAGSVEHAATELSIPERAELVRLLRDELKRMGA